MSIILVETGRGLEVGMWGVHSHSGCSTKLKHGSVGLDQGAIAIEKCWYPFSTGQAMQGRGHNFLLLWNNQLDNTLPPNPILYGKFSSTDKEKFASSYLDMITVDVVDGWLLGSFGFSEIRGIGGAGLCFGEEPINTSSMVA